MNFEVEARDDVDTPIHYEHVMELTFVNQYAGDTPKRRRLAKACDACRARKVGPPTLHHGRANL